MTASKTTNILLAEDDRTHQHLLLMVLASGRPQVHVTVVDTGTEFLKALRGGSFDCAIVDYNLPDYCADELLHAAASDLRDCPVLVISSSSEQEIVISSVRSGSADFVSKRNALVGDELWKRVEHAVLVQRRLRLERRKAEQRQRYLSGLAEHDPLTGLYNRRHLENCLQKQRWQHDRRLGMSCTLIDIDHFKDVNDRYGHKVGDAVLREVAALVQRAVSAGDVAVRWGGEELLVVKWQPSLEDAWLWADALRREIEAHTIPTDGARLQVTVSIGLTHCPSSTFGTETIDLTDQALYLAKNQGRNRICTCDMVFVARILEGIAALPALDSEQRRYELIERLADHLGPTQREHLTAHCELVSRTAGRVAELLGLPSAEVERVRLAGLMHDIGKCVIPEGLLAKPRTLSIEEWRLMAGHDQYGQWIAERLGVDATTIADIRHHHQRYDEFGGGDAGADEWESGREPMAGGCRLAGDDPRSWQDGRGHDDHRGLRGARILCVADALVAMLSQRCYRAAQPLAHALAELRRERGRQFAPEVVDAAHFLEADHLPMAA